MSAGWATAFLGAIVGGLVAGIFMLLGQWIQHRRLRRERIQEMLLGQRIAAYMELTRRLSELEWELQLGPMGLEPLRWPKNWRVSPQFFEKSEEAADDLERQKALARKTSERLDGLVEFVHAHALVLAPKVRLAFWEAFSGFDKWRIRVRNSTDPELRELCPGYDKETEKAFAGLGERTREAITQDLSLRDFGFPGSRDRETAWRRGVKKAKATLGMSG